MSRTMIDARLKRMIREGPEAQESKNGYVAEMEGVWGRMDDVQRDGIDQMRHERFRIRPELKPKIKQHERCEKEKARTARRGKEEQERRVESQQAQPANRDRHQELGERYGEAFGTESPEAMGKDGPRGSSERPACMALLARSVSMYGNAGSQESITDDGAGGLVSDSEGGDVHDDQ